MVGWDRLILWAPVSIGRRGKLEFAFDRKVDEGLNVEIFIAMKGNAKMFFPIQVFKDVSRGTDVSWQWEMLKFGEN